MSAPKPAEPSEGAMFLRLRDVPEGWEYRFGYEAPNEWWVKSTSNYGYGGEALAKLVEARQTPEPLVAVMLPRSVVEAGAEVWADVVEVGALDSEHWFDTIQDACRAALAEADQ